MAIVITNGQYYMRFNEKGQIKKTPDITEARKFYNVNVASRKLQEKSNKSPAKCAGYYVFDTEGDEHAVSKTKKVTERKHYSKDVRKMIYNNADGKCYLCGRKILYKDMTLDHVVPLAMGGADEVENLSCTCFSCNQFKGSILPSALMERISQIYLYQIDKKYCSKLKWKMIRKMILKLSVIESV